MSGKLLTYHVWPQITKAAKRHRGFAAIAYFGKGAADLLPLRPGSRLVVNASEAAVKSGQTHPADLKRLLNRGVRIFSVPNLHAKLIVLGRWAFVGSANASQRSAKSLIEAAVATTDRDVVSAAREFIQANCLHELTPEVLKRLGQLYKPPKVPRGRGRRKPDSADRPTLPRLMLAQLELEDWSDQDQAFHDEGMQIAKKYYEHPRSYKKDSFRWALMCPFRRRDVVIQVTDEGRGGVWASPPGNVRLVRTRRGSGRPVSFVYVEIPAQRRRRVQDLAKKLGKGSLKRLKKIGLVRDPLFAADLLRIWGK